MLTAATAAVPSDETISRSAAVSIISITDKGKTITYHAHHMRDVIEPVKQYGMFREQLNAKKKLHTLTFYTED